MLTTITPAIEEPVSVDDVRLHLRVNHTADDALLAALITASREWIEQFTGRALAAATYSWERMEAHLPIPLLPATVASDVAGLVTFTTAPGIVPEALRAAIKLRVQADYEATPAEAESLRASAERMAFPWRANLGA